MRLTGRVVSQVRDPQLDFVRPRRQRDLADDLRRRESSRIETERASQETLILVRKAQMNPARELVALDLAELKLHGIRLRDRRRLAAGRFPTPLDHGNLCETLIRFDLDLQTLIGLVIAG